MPAKNGVKIFAGKSRYGLNSFSTRIDFGKIIFVLNLKTRS